MRDVSEPTTRVAIWNSFLRLAWEQARAVYELENDCEVKRSFSAGATPILPDDDFHVLAAVVLSNLAIEARANHLIEELFEEDQISSEVWKAALRLPTKHKWFLLPTLAGKTRDLGAADGPHQAVAQLCDLRNDFIHVNYDAMKSKLPTKGTVLSYFERFIVAMEDMNVVLGRHDAPSDEVLDLRKFECK